MHKEQELVEFRGRRDYFWLGNQIGLIKEVTFSLDGAFTVEAASGGPVNCMGKGTEVERYWV